MWPDGVYYKFIDGVYLVAKKGDRRTCGNREGNGLFGQFHFTLKKHEQSYDFEWKWLKEESFSRIAPFELIGWEDDHLET